MGKGGELKKTAEETAAADISWKMWNDFKEVYLPVMEDVSGKQLDPNFRRSNEMSDVGAQATEAYSDARAEVGSQAVARGINPNSGAVDSAVDNIGVAQGQGIGSAEINVSQGRESSRRAAGTGLVATSRGVEGQTVTGLNRVAQIKDQKQQTIDAAHNAEMSTYGNLVGQAAGIGIGMKLNQR